uniref:Rho guanine nucleotide exchange factor 2 n=1 Tax=Denticeps clupeoides TaxID=299321 RepID=A0AAY4C432_9TELE
MTFTLPSPLCPQNKEKERMKEREKEAREREARYSNGHLFTSLTVSATTLCSACNKSITAKEALSCPTCNVTIHNRCRDTLPNCAKMKQKQQKLAMVRNNSALQNVALRTKTPIMKERPNSAIYPSDSLRQSLLGARRVRSGLSLSKSVSTNNIAGNLNDDSPLGLRRILSQSTDSLNFRNRAMSMESLNDEGEVYSSVLEELEREGRDFEADSWSLAVDASYLQTHRKDVIKRQDVIYELIQTELHHVRTLRIMEGVFRRGMLEEVQLEPGVAHAVFPCLDRLLALHTQFLAQLLVRKNDSLAPDSKANFTINKLGDVLVEQFSGPCADDMRKTYAEFCSRHLKAVKLYKELLARDKRFQQFIRRASRGPLLRRHGIQECILLVTQRITKYPVLIQRILDNSKGNEEEAESLSQALTLIKELLSSVNQQVQELERTQRLQEIQARMDPWTETEVRGGGVFRGAELQRRTLIHEGTLLWKTSSRLKDVQVLLMTDILVFMQEKDQKYFFAALDKPAVLSLQNLIVRDIASQERGMFFISDSTPPEMYEIHAASKDDRNTWMRLIQQTVKVIYSTSDIQQKDREVLELLQERVTLFSDLVTGGQEVALPTNCRNVFRADTPHAPQAEKILNEAIAEAACTSGTVYSTAHMHFLCCLQFSVLLTPPFFPSCHHQAAVICQDSMLELSKLCRSLSRDTGLDVGILGAGGDVTLLQRQCSLLQEEVVRLRLTEVKLKESEKSRLLLEQQIRDMQAGCFGAGIRQQNTTDATTLQVSSFVTFDLFIHKVAPQGKSSEGDATPLAPLACQETVDQLDGLQEGSEDEDNSDEEEEVRITPRSDSPRG